MTKNMNIRSIFINLPIKNIEKSREFWTVLGFGFNEQFCDDNALCLVLNDGTIYAMLISYELYSTFTNRPIADGTTTQVLLSIDVGSRDRVDEIMVAALQNGATRYLEPSDMGWMYYDRFVDPDGHQWEITYINESLIPQENNNTMNNPQTHQHESDLPMSIGKPAFRALSQAGYLKLDQFTQLREKDVLKLHGVGPKAIRVIRQALAEVGKSFAE